MTRPHLAPVLAALVLCAPALGAPFECDAEFGTRHGVTCYIPFEGDGSPQFTRTGSAPTYRDSLHFVDGKIGRGVLLRKSRERELGKTRGRASGLNFDATGLLYGERGAIAFWFQPQWDGDDPTIRSGSSSTGPSLFAVSSVEPTYYRQFIRMQIKAGSFYIWVVDASGKWHGPNYGAQVKAWRKEEWHHLVLTWDCERGVRFFDNGRRKATGLESLLRDRSVDEVYVMGLATDYCVKATAVDAAAQGFKTRLILDGCRGVELEPGDIANAIEDMKAVGVSVGAAEDVTAARR